ncbi:ligase-associated DNA damage response exonuclease [soil metagenome]
MGGSHHTRNKRPPVRAPLLQLTEAGLYCPRGDFYIDPLKTVPRAVITHGHSDHARPGMGAYLCHHDSIPVLQHRFRGRGLFDGLSYGERRVVNGVTLSLHPAGHIIGSAQIRIEVDDDVWVVSGDYKRQPDPLAPLFEPLRCNVFITESTFGLPIFQWPSVEEIMKKMHAWWQGNIERNVVSMIQAYPLGKAQRLLFLLDQSIGPVFLHASVADMYMALRASGINLPDAEILTPATTPEQLRSAMVITPGIANSLNIGPSEIAMASGWMAVRSMRQRSSSGIGFVMSDHIDWPDLHRTIEETEAETVYVTHGYEDDVVRYLHEQGRDARPLAHLSVARR